MPGFVAGDGVRLHYEEAGEGPAIVFVHGWMMSAGFFRRQLEGLASDRRCIALDLRGCGRSEGRPGTYRMDRFAEDVGDLLRHLRLAEATLCGWSLGGGISMRYIDRFAADRVHGVALVDFPPKFEEDPAIPAKVCERLRTDRDRFTTGFFKRMFLSEPPPDELAWLRAENARCSNETGCETYTQLGVGSSRGRTFDLPALLVFPEQGWYPKAADEWKTIFPRHVAPPFRQSRHCPFLEEPDAFNEALRSFTA